MTVQEQERPIKVLHVTFNMGIGGTEQVIRQLVTGLPPKYFTTQIVCIDGHIGEVGQQIQKSGTKVIALERHSGLDKELVRNLRQVIREFDADILHCHQYTPWVYGWLASRGTSAKTVFTEHGRFHPDRYRYKAVLINPLMALFTNAVVAISSATRNALAKYEFIPKWKIKVIYNGIRALSGNDSTSTRIRQELGIPDSSFVMGTVARLDPVKNQAMMLEAFSDVLEVHPDTWLLMVGDGPDRSMLEQKARELGISERISFTGFISSPADHLALMDLFLLSSHTEGTSMTLLEAMSLGVPAVVTDVGGNGEVVEDGVTGYLTLAGSKEAFRDAIVKVIDNPDVARKMAVNSRQTFQARYDVAAMVKAYTSCYSSLC